MGFGIDQRERNDCSGVVVGVDEYDNLYVVDCVEVRRFRTC